MYCPKERNFKYKNIERSKVNGQSFPEGSEVKNLPGKAEDVGSTPDLDDPTCGRAVRAVCHSY